MDTSRILLDTCALVWLAQGADFAPAARKTIEEVAQKGGEICVSPISAWEIGMLASKGRLAITMTPERWFQVFMRESGAVLEALTPSALIASSFLPAPLHSDPVDRMLIATARESGLTLMTRDRKILDYGEAGYVNILEC